MMHLNPVLDSKGEGIIVTRGAKTFDLYARSFGSSYAKSFFWVMWELCEGL